MGYDFVIVGAGSAGCVLANRLSADPTARVLLLEAGGPDKHPFIHMPAGFLMLVGKGLMDWGYHTEPQSGLGGRKTHMIRGKVLGGSSSVNGCTWLRGNPADFDHWASLGNRGWSYSDCLPYFKQSENHELGETQYHGAAGPMRITRAVATNPLAIAWTEAGAQAGYRRNDDLNGETIEGFGCGDRTIYKGRRISSSVAYLRPAMSRGNLTVAVGSRATRVIFDGRRAVGVEFIGSNGPEIARANREVILAAGAINSPQLLLLSGIGESAQLRRFGIRTITELKGVGLNLQDHVCASNQWACTKPVSLFGNLRPLRALGSLCQYALFRDGPSATNGLEAIAFLRSDASIPEPDLQFHFVMLIYENHGRVIKKHHGFMPLFNACYPESRGYVALRSADALERPIIQTNALQTERDIDMLRRGLTISRNIVSQKAFDEFRGAEIGPPAEASRGESVDSYLRAQADTNFHCVGTCKMGTDEFAVVDPDLKVRGVEGLRVIDASIMPRIVASNVNAATIMIAEKGAGIICRRGDKSGYRPGVAMADSQKPNLAL